MILGIDIDDTIMDSYNYFQPYVASYFDKDLSILINNKISYANIPKEWGKEEEFAKEYYDKIVVDTLIKKDSKYYLDKLKKDGHRIIIITARDKKLYKNPYYTTKEELDKNNIPYDKLICSRNKDEVCVNEEVELFIDDMVKNCDLVSDKGIMTLLFTSPINENVKTYHKRVNNWSKIYELVNIFSNN